MKMEQVHGELELAKSEIERLKFNVNEKESEIQHLRCANNKLRNDSDSKLRKVEDDKIELVKALDEAEGVRRGQERAIGVLQSELDNIKVMLSASQKRCSDAEQEAKSLKESCLKDDRLGRLEEGKRRVEDELKWKKEQFELLIQAHEKLKSESEASKREWELERRSLLDEMRSFQSTLDCRNSKAESLRTQPDRDSLREIESELKEAKYSVKKLEKENRELLSTVRELQESHIPKAPPSTPPSTVNKIKSKLRSLEQAHKDCALNLRSKEADWSSQMQMMRRDLEDSKLSLKLEEASMKKELEACNAMNRELKMQNEELSLMLQIQNSVEMLDECCRERDGLKQEVMELCGVIESLECEVSETGFELQIWRSVGERLRAQLEESQRLRGELELSLLAQAGFEEELKLEMYSLKQQLGLITPEYDEEEEEVNKQFLNVAVGKGGEMRASKERSPFREIN